MIRYSGVFLSLLMISGCATDALKNEQAETVITAGNKAVAANASFFKQYYASRENFLVNFYATNPECAPRPDYEVVIENSTSNESLCQQPGDKHKKSQEDLFTTKIVTTEKERLLASMEIISSMSSYIELLNEDLDVKDSKQFILLKQALDHANNAGALLGINDGGTLTKSAAAVKDLVVYFNGLYNTRVSAGNIGSTVNNHWQRIKNDLTDIRNDIATKGKQTGRNTFATVHNNLVYYNASLKKGGGNEFKTLKSRQEFLAAIISINETRLRAADPAIPAIQALNSFLDEGNHLKDLYTNKTRTAAEQKRLNEILRAQVISGLKASEGLAKLLIASGIML